MKIEIREADHARLVALAEARGEPDLSQVVNDALNTYFAVQGQSEPGDLPEPPKESRWAAVARFHRENPSLTGKSEEVNELIREFREEFAI